MNGWTEMELEVLCGLPFAVAVDLDGEVVGHGPILRYERTADQMMQAPLAGIRVLHSHTHPTRIVGIVGLSGIGNGMPDINCLQMCG